MTMKRLVLHFFLLSMLSSPLLFAIDNLKLNSKLDYTSDSLDGPLITGDDAQSGFVPGKPNYVIIYAKDASTPKDRRSALLSCTTNTAPRCTLSSSTWTFSARPSSKNWSSGTTRAISPTFSCWMPTVKPFITSLEKWTPSLSRISSRRLSVTDQRISADCVVRGRAQRQS